MAKIHQLVDGRGRTVIAVGLGQAGDSSVLPNCWPAWRCTDSAPIDQALDLRASSH